MRSVPCACGATQKQFANDIGPFFVNECCTKAGYDELGKKSKVQSPEITPEVVTEPSVALAVTPLSAEGPEEQTEAQPNAMSKLLSTLGLRSAPAGGRGKLMDMTVPALKELAKSKNIEVSEDLNKKQIVDLIMTSA